MTVGIVGLGLIGGSMARAYKKAGNKVLAFDTDEKTLGFAMVSEVADEKLTGENIHECELVFVCVMPEDGVAFLKENAAKIQKTATVIDCCGTKRNICKAGFALAEEYGFTFVGGHPMAGTHKSGFKNSRSDMFKGAPMVLVPPVFDDASLIEKTEKLLEPAGFGSFSVTTAEKHDVMIAFTSQMPHLVSNAFIKSPTAGSHKGFSAGSYKDLTRVAWLNSGMWAELFLENRENVLSELDLFIENLSSYREALVNGNKEQLLELLEEGKIKKEQVDG